MDKQTKRLIREKILDQSIYEEKRYKNWRKKVFTRDRYKCQFPGCKKVGGSLQAHHIKGKYKFPETIYSLENGITLCWACHNNLHKNKEEKKYQKIFQTKAKGNKPRPRMVAKSKVLGRLGKRGSYVKNVRSQRGRKRYCR